MYFDHFFCYFLNEMNFLLLFLYDNMEHLILLLLILSIFLFLALRKNIKLSELSNQ